MTIYHWSTAFKLTTDTLVSVIISVSLDVACLTMICLATFSIVLLIPPSSSGTKRNTLHYASLGEDKVSNLHQNALLLPLKNNNLHSQHILQMC